MWGEIRIMKLYLSSVVMWFLILKATECFCRKIMKNRTDIDYKKYIKENQKIVK